MENFDVLYGDFQLGAGDFQLGAGDFQLGAGDFQLGAGDFQLGATEVFLLPNVFFLKVLSDHFHPDRQPTHRDNLKDNYFQSLFVHTQTLDKPDPSDPFW